MKQPDSLNGPSVKTSIIALNLTAVSVCAVSLFPFHRRISFGRPYGIIGNS